jgi:hypothetical protein
VAGVEGWKGGRVAGWKGEGGRVGGKGKGGWKREGVEKGG